MWGLIQLWLATLWDLALTAAREQFSTLMHRSNEPMSPSPLNEFDRQLGDAVWVMTTALRSGYNVKQVVEMLAQEAPEPTASEFKRTLQEIEQGRPMLEALQDLHNRMPSAHFAVIVDALKKQRAEGGNLAERLEPLGEAILKQAGSDPAFYPAMRRAAERTGAMLPDRARD
jgi:type II secretory pathway component PulF